MKGYIAVTDNDWFAFLSQQREIDEVNFWQPGGGSRFRSLSPGEPFFFKLHSPYHFIVGGGFFTHSTILPVSLAWSTFGIKNGASSYAEMRRLIERNRHSPPSQEDYKIGCILLTQLFFRRHDWIPVPPDFSLNIVQGKAYDLGRGHGRQLWEQVLARLPSIHSIEHEGKIAEPEGRYGEPTLVLPRLGQGIFRVIVTDAYERRCAVTQEKTLPALEAAHIKPFSDSGPHRVENGILLRSDIHRLFDLGYVTVTPEYHFEVSHRIREDFDNGKTYLNLHGNIIHVPPNPRLRPGSEFLTWHNENIFKS